MDVVQKTWGFCNVLKRDWVNCGDYIEQTGYGFTIHLLLERCLNLDLWDDSPAPTPCMIEKVFLLPLPKGEEGNSPVLRRESIKVTGSVVWQVWHRSIGYGSSI